MKKYFTTVLITFLLFVFTGCATRNVTVSPGGHVSAPEDIIKTVSKTDNIKETLEAIASIVVNTPGRRYSTKIALIAKRPSSLKVTSIPVIAPPLFFLSVTGGSLKVFLPNKGEFYIGRATRKNLSLFFPVNLKVEDIVSILFGVPPPVTGENSALQGYVEGKLYRIDVTSQDKKTLSLWVDTSTGNLVRTEVFTNDGKILYRVRFEGHGKIETTPITCVNLRFPENITIAENEADRPTVHIRYSNIHLRQNEEDTDLFDLDIPPGIKPIFIDR